MEYMIFLAATLALAVSFPHWEPTGRMRATGCKSRFLGLTGVVGHLGGAAAIAWLSGFLAGAVAFLSIPLAASVIYTLIVMPLGKSMRGKSQVRSRRRGTREIFSPCWPELENGKPATASWVRIRRI